MATITITIPDAQVQRVREGIAYAMRVDVTDVDLPFVKQLLVDKIKATVLNAEAEQARIAAEQAATPIDAT